MHMPMLSARLSLPRMTMPVRCFTTATLETDSDDDEDFDLFNDIKEVLTAEES